MLDGVGHDRAARLHDAVAVSRRRHAGVVRAGHRSKATAAYNHGQYLRLLDALEARLAGRDYIMGATFSLADIPAAAALLSGLALGGSVEGRKNVEAWLARCRARPAFARIGGAG